MIKVKSLKYATYKITDLDKQQDFLEDFGLITVKKTATHLYMRGASSSPYIYVAEKSDKPGFISFAMEAGSEEDFITASKFEGASEIRDLDGPGGGRYIRFENAPGGIVMDVVYGIADAEAMALKEPEPFNAIRIKNRVNVTVRPDRNNVPHISRVGHLAMTVTDATAAKNWLSENFGILVSDTMLVPGDTDKILGYFVRLDLGETPADHHTFLLTNGERFEPHHLSFEVEDLDALYMGNEWLKERDRIHHWGPGRHVIGSQIFDYWWDPDGFRLEHYTDGDVFDNTIPPGEPMEATFDNLWAWGPKFPEDFFNARED